MLKNLIFSILFIGGMNFSIGHSSLYGSILQEEVMANDNISSLLNLVGQKCTVFLKNGDGKYGTLWELGEDFIILKIKKGPLYSKEEKFAISEIKFLEDSDGNKIEIKNIKANESKAEYFKDSKTEESYIPLETVLKNSNEKESGQKDNRLNQSSISLQSKSSKSTQELSFKSNGSKKTEPTNPGLVVVSRPSKNTKKNTRGIKQSLNKKQKTVQNAKAKTKTAETEIQQQPIASKEVVETVTPETKKIRILKYQTAILFSATLMAFTFIFFLKIKGMKGYTYDKNSLFPSRLIKMNGEYGLIDQGLDEGVKVDDIIKFYRKLGRNINYIGKVKVIKVADNYSAVKLVKNSKHGPLDKGDVGFRDRSFFLSAAKELRKFIGKSCRSLAKGLDYAAKNLAIETEEPEIDTITMDNIFKKKGQTKKTVKQGKNVKRKTNKPAAQSADESILVGFGMEDK